MSDTLRPDLWLITKLIPEGSRVLDLGCGDGELLRLLTLKGCSGTGVDMDPSNLVAAMRSLATRITMRDAGCVPRPSRPHAQKAAIRGVSTLARS